ncbi:MAG: S4 domain-containing protein, partial [Propionivibrio sp.]
MSRPTLKLPIKPAPAERGEVRRTTVRKAPHRRSSPPKQAPEPFTVPPAVPNPAPPASAAPPAKLHPQRGIARSTGARALPPARPREETPEAGERSRAKVPNDDERPRLAHLITRQCGCSRREADDWIENGWVRVDGAVVSTLGIRVDRGARIEISDEAGKHQNERVTL